MDEVFGAAIIVGILFIGLPWLILHHVTKWKTAPTLTNDDERMLGDMYELARKLEERLETVERLVASDNPDWNQRRLTRPTPEQLSEDIRKLERDR